MAAVMAPPSAGYCVSVCPCLWSTEAMGGIIHPDSLPLPLSLSLNLVPPPAPPHPFTADLSALGFALLIEADRI